MVSIFSLHFICITTDTKAKMAGSKNNSYYVAQFDILEQSVSVTQQTLTTGIKHMKQRDVLGLKAFTNIQHMFN